MTTTQEIRRSFLERQENTVNNHLLVVSEKRYCTLNHSVCSSKNVCEDSKNPPLLFQNVRWCFSSSLRKSSFEEHKLSGSIRIKNNSRWKKNRTTTGHSDTVRRTCALQLRSGALSRTPHLQKNSHLWSACGHRLNEWILFKVQCTSPRLRYLREKTEEIKGSWWPHSLCHCCQDKPNKIKKTSRVY